MVMLDQGMTGTLFLISLGAIAPTILLKLLLREALSIFPPLNMFQPLVEWLQMLLALQQF